MFLSDPDSLRVRARWLSAGSRCAILQAEEKNREEHEASPPSYRCGSWELRLFWALKPGDWGDQELLGSSEYP
jgi:hypothetical protein